MAAPVVESISSSTIDNADLSITKPSGTVEGDLLVATGIVGNGADRYLSPPAGWTEIVSDMNAISGSSSMWVQAWYKIAGGSEPSSYTFTQNQTFTKSNLVLSRISGAEDPATTAIEYATSANGASGTADTPSITPKVDDSLVTRFAGSARTSSGAITPPTGYTEQYDLRSVYSAWLASKTQGASATGTEAFTYTPTWWSSPAWGHIALAIAPAGGGGGTEYTLTITAGSYSTTGQSVDLPVARSLAITSGSYGTTGQSIGLIVNRSLALTAGSYSTTGQSVGLPASRSLAINAGKHDLTGIFVQFTVAQTLSLTSGSYSTTGQSIGLGSAYTLTITDGSYSTTGQSIGLARAINLAITPGSYSTTGQSVTLTASNETGSMVTQYFNYLGA